MDLAYELHDVVRTLDPHAEQLLRVHAPSYHRHVAPVIVGEHPGMSGRDLARGLSIAEASGSAMVRRLLVDGLLRDAAPSGSGHRRRLRLTTEGVRRRDRVAASLGDALDRKVQRLGLDPVELARTIRAIHDEVRTPGGEAQP